MTNTPFTAEQFAKLGAGQVAYVREMTSDEFKTIFPQANDLQPGVKLFALLSAEGAPIVLADRATPPSPAPGRTSFRP